MRFIYTLPIVMTLTSCASKNYQKQAADQQDNATTSNRWLEDISSRKSLRWVKRQNLKSIKRLSNQANFSEVLENSNESLSRKDSLPNGQLIGDYVYVFETDSHHRRGYWKRAEINSYTRPEATKWEKVLDLDSIAKKEKKNWYWAGADCLGPKYEKCILSFSIDGSDAIES